MRPIPAMAGALALAFATTYSTTSSADIIYSETYIAIPPGGGAVPAYSWEYISPGFITTTLTVDASRLAAHSAGVNDVTFYPGCPTFFPTPCAEIQTLVNTSNRISTTYSEGAFTATGTYYNGSLGTLTVTQQQAVPEPSGLALLGMGILGMLGFARRRGMAPTRRPA